MTATTLLNESAEELLLATGPGVRSIMMGPSTPLVPAAFAHLPLTALAGIVACDATAVEKAVRHGSATPGMKPYVRKVYCVCAPYPGRRAANVHRVRPPATATPFPGVMHG